MTEKIIQQFIQFIKTVDDEIIEFINLKNNELTKNISGIQWDLWKNYKKINGTSAGFHGISEYIVFSTFKNFIEDLNKPQKFEPKVNRDLCSFKLEKNNKVLMIYRASSLKHIGFKSNRAPDITIVRKEGDVLKPVAVIEIKNYLDKGSTNSAIEILSQVQERIEDEHTKYALFSFGKISVDDEKIKENLKKFTENKNNFLITNEEQKNMEFKVIDLSEFFNIIKDEVIL